MSPFWGLLTLISTLPKALKRRYDIGVGATHVTIISTPKEHRRCDIIPYLADRYKITP